MGSIHVENDNSQNLVTTTETPVGVIALPGAVFVLPGEQVPLIPAELEGVLNVTAGAAATAVQVRVRHGVNTITGAVIGNAETHTLAAGASADIAFEVYDAVGDAAGYTVTVQQVAATGNGTCNSSSFDCLQQ